MDEAFKSGGYEERRTSGRFADARRDATVSDGMLSQVVDGKERDTAVGPKARRVKRAS